MPKVKPELFDFLNNPKLEEVLYREYTLAVKQINAVLWHFLPKAFQFFGKGIDWSKENETFYDDKYVPIVPEQGKFLYMQARALQAKHIFEFGTSYGISTLYLAKAVKENGGKVFTTEYVPEKIKRAKKNFVDAGLEDFIEILEGDALETVKNIKEEIDFVLLDGWPNMVFPVFKLIEPLLKKGAVVVVDDVKGFEISMKDYLDYVRNAKNGYLSTLIRPNKSMEFTVKI